MCETLIEEYRKKIEELTAKNHCLYEENQDLKYQLNDMQESLDIANDEAVVLKLTVQEYHQPIRIWLVFSSITVIQ